MWTTNSCSSPSPSSPQHDSLFGSNRAVAAATTTAKFPTSFSGMIFSSSSSPAPHHSGPELFAFEEEEDCSGLMMDTSVGSGSNNSSSHDCESPFFWSLSSSSNNNHQLPRQQLHPTAYKQQQQLPDSNNLSAIMQQELRQKRENRRRRHYSLEEFAPECEDSNSSSNFCNSPKLLPIHGEESSESAKEKNDLNPIKSFMFDTDLAEDALLCFSDTTASGLFNSASESALKETSLEFEGSLLRFFDSCREENNVAVEFPEGLLAIIVAHVMQEAAEEPYGVKGCVLHVQYEGQTALHHLGTLQVDPDTLATFQITLTLRQAQTSWSQRMARRLSFSSSSSPLTMAVSTSYKLVKKRTYRPHEALEFDVTV